MWSLTVLLMAMLVDGSWQKDQRLKEVYTRLGLGMVPYPGMALPESVGTPVLSFEDGMVIVRLDKPEDFLFVGESMDNFFIGGGSRAHGIRNNRGTLRKITELGKVSSFALLDRDRVPVLVFYLSADPKSGKLKISQYDANVLARGDRQGDIPEKYRNHLLSFWFDAREFLVEPVFKMSAYAFSVRPLEEEWKNIVRNWEYNTSSWQDDDFVRWVKETAYYEESPDEDWEEDYDSAVVALENLEEGLTELVTKVIDSMDRLGVVSFSNRDVNRIAGKSGKTSRWSWEIIDPESPEALLDTWSYKLFWVRRYPKAAWIRKHSVEKDPLRYELTQPLIYWRLENRSGERVGKKIPSHVGPFNVLDDLFGFKKVSEEEIEDLKADAEEVSRYTPRKWLVSVSEAVMPVTTATEEEWPD